MSLSPELLKEIEAAIKSGALNLGGRADGRSPIKPRQLHNLMLSPTATDPRPTFFMSAEAPRDGSAAVATEFPKLLWHGTTGTEITVRSIADQQAHLSMGYVMKAPFAIALDPMADLQAQFDALPQADREAMLQSIERDRVEKLKSRLGAISPEQLEALLAATERPIKKGKVA